ncbi:MAG TPA: hypothetical protein VMK12_14810 [Anaeromyxobacteraceae bacterium]|nr:hypothetical protein [Anaeromyxobacteraceae bacterium]
MKFFELVTLIGSDGVSRLIADPRATPYVVCCGRDASAEERALFDQDLPDDLCRSAFGACPARYCLDGNWLRKESGDIGAQGGAGASFTVLEVYDRFGTEALMAVEELAAFDVSKKK